MEEEKNGSLLPVDDKTMTKKEFWIRFPIWFALAVAAPVAYILVKYDIFVSTNDKKLSGWGIIAVLFTFAMVMGILSSAKKGLRRGTMMRQCLDGFTLLLPILAVILILQYLKTRIADFEAFLVFMILCEAVAIPVNPIPKWAAQNDGMTLMEIITKAIRKSKE